MNYSNRLPWTERPWQILMEAKEKNRLPHALLFVGLPGLGKSVLAHQFAHALLCKAAGDPCGQCQACHLIRANSHPDLMIIRPEEAGQMIKIDQIRELIPIVNTTPLLGHARIIVIEHAEALNMAAANALLKTLEEPTPNTLLMLISDLNLNLPATIISRCQKIFFKKPERLDALEWLKLQEPTQNPTNRELALNLSQGAPLRALDMLQSDTLSLRQILCEGLGALSQKKADPIALAKICVEYDLQSVLQLLLSWVYDLLRFKLTNGRATLMHFDCAALFSALNIAPYSLLCYIDIVEERFRKIIHLQNLNRQLLLEELLIRWAHCYVPS